MLRNSHNIKAIIFDMDGVVSDTQILHATAESEMVKEHGIDIHPDELTKRYAGTTSKEMLPHLFKSFSKELPKALHELIHDRYQRVVAATKGNVAEVPGTREFIAHIKKKKLLIAIGSASRLEYINLVLTELHLKKEFNAVASAEEVENGKPAPDVFLLAAKKLGIEPGACLVIEDGISGMIAARSAGMQCVGLVRTDDLDYVAYPADLLVKSCVELISFF